jgi:hypothetical protein
MGRFRLLRQAQDASPSSIFDRHGETIERRSIERVLALSRAKDLDTFELAPELENRRRQTTKHRKIQRQEETL